MREIQVDTQQLVGDDGAKHKFAYSIVVDQLAVGGMDCESYGVQIASTDADGELAQIPNITLSISRIDALMELLTRNQVTPATLRDVVEDWL